MNPLPGPPRSTRALALLLVLLPFLLLAIGLARTTVGTERLLPMLSEASDVGRIELARGREQVVLVRRLDTGAWVLASAADAPGDVARVEAAIEALARLRGRPVADGAPAPRREPLRVRIEGREGIILGDAALWADEAHALPDGPRLAIVAPPALPLWQSAWSSLEAPRIDPNDVVAAQRIGPGGPEALPEAERKAIAALLARLDTREFRAAAGLDWSRADAVRLTLADGAIVDLQLRAAPGNGLYLRMTSDRRSDVRAVRRFAFRAELARR